MDSTPETAEITVRAHVHLSTELENACARLGGMYSAPGKPGDPESCRLPAGDVIEVQDDHISIGINGADGIRASVWAPRVEGSAEIHAPSADAAVFAVGGPAAVVIGRNHKGFTGEA